MHAHLIQQGRAEVLSATDDEALDAAFHLAATEGIIPALESAHALAVLDKIQLPEGSNVIVCLSGRGDKDMNTYMQRMQQLSDR